MFEIGRVCMKTAGREAGKYCVVLKKEEPGFVLITGPKVLTKVKRRKCNIHHLEPLVEKIKIKSEASDDEVMKALKEEKVFEKLGFKVVVAGKPIEKKPEVAAKKLEAKKEEHHAAKKEAPRAKRAKPKKAKPAPKKESKPAKKAAKPKKPAAKKK